MDQKSEQLEKINERFTKLLLKHQGRIYGYILTLVPNLTDAEDIFQDVVMVMCQKFDKFEGEHFSAWGIEIARNKVLKYRFKHATSKVVLDEDVLGRLIERASQKFQQQEDRIEHLDHCIQKLNATDQKLLEFRYKVGMKVKEISATVNRPVTALYQAFSRIQLSLRECVHRQKMIEDR